MPTNFKKESITVELRDFNFRRLNMSCFAKAEDVEILEKAVKDKSKLVKKIITNKSGKKQGVWAKQGEDSKKQSKVAMAAEVMEAFNFLGIDKSEFEARRKKAGGLEQLHEQMGKELSGKKKQSSSDTKKVKDHIVKKLDAYFESMKDKDADPDNPQSEELNDVLSELDDYINIGGDMDAGLGEHIGDILNGFEGGDTSALKARCKVMSILNEHSNKLDSSKHKSFKTNKIKKSEIIQVLKGTYEHSSDEIQKAVDDEEFDTISKALGSFRYSSTIKFKKKGADIIAKLKEAILLIVKKKEDIASRLAVLEEAIGSAPTEKYTYYDEGLKESDLVGIKTYMYNMCESSSGGTGKCEASPTLYSTDANKSVPGTTSADVAKNCREYNNLVYDLVNCMRDISIVAMYSRNLDPKVMYELSPEQVIELGF